jgi:arsenite methyltransferase
MSREKEWVKQRYGAIARRACRSCCPQPACCPDSAAAAAEKTGYTTPDLAAAPEGANLGLGCGNPLALATISPGDTVLDLGSGAGFDAFLAAQRVGPSGRVIGVDMTSDMIAQARAGARRAGYTNVTFRLGDIEALPVEDASIDLVISNCVLNLVPDKPKAFREIARVLKPGGRVSIADIVLHGPLPGALGATADGYTSCVSGAISRREYLAGLQAAGLEDIRVVSEADASDLLGSDCCSAGVSASDLKGIVTSIHVTARRPASCCPNSAPTGGCS